VKVLRREYGFAQVLFEEKIVGMENSGVVNEAVVVVGDRFRRRSY
jgi:hypothetical protein